MNFQEKKDSLCEKYGIKYFAYSRDDLNIFTMDELRQLVDDGLVEDFELHRRTLIN